MISGWVLLLVSAVYVGVLFWVAHYGDRKPLYPERAWLRPIVYSLALAVYCSSWTFYGAVGSAAHSGWGYLPIYLGPVLLFVLFQSIPKRLVQIAHEQSITSIADFLGSRYGKSQGLAALVTLIALIAAVPYIALQFKAGSMSIDVLSGQGPRLSSVPMLADSAFWMAGMLAVFAILFGTRQIDATEHHHGLMLAVALESVVKLVAFVAIGLFALPLMPDHWAETMAAASTRTGPLPSGFVAQTLLAMLAMFCLPRQFQVGVVECENPNDVRTARWMFPTYLVIITALVVPISMAGMAMFDGTTVHPDTFVLELPLQSGQPGLALLAYLGGFSAATGMVIVAAVALATMVSNDLVVPAMLRLQRFADSGVPDLSKLVLRVRRITIVLLALAAYGYHRASESNQNLASIGLLSFVAVAQFAPAIIAGLYWRGASRTGAIGGLIAGFAVWAYTLMLPTLVSAGWLDRGWMDLGPGDLVWLRPHALFGLSGWDPITHGTFWSLLANIAGLLFLSLRWRPSIDERLRALPFIDPWYRRQQAAVSEWHGRLNIGDLRALCGRILGQKPTVRAFEEYARENARLLVDGELADRSLLQFTERLLAGAIGGASARRVLTTALRGTGLDLGEVVSLLDETSQELRFNRELLAATLENITQGISVVDAEMRLVAWNRRYLEIFDYPDGLVYVGRPVADLIRYNAERGECGPGDVDDHVAKRIKYMQRGSAHVFERVRHDGTVIEMRGRPMPGGGFATTFTDVTAYKRVEHALIDANEMLESRVVQRTAELSRALEAQRAAKQEAETANQSKTRFLAAASHDLLQPLNAARLFTAALHARDGVDAEDRLLSERIDSSLRAAEDLLDGLLDISRLDAGSMQPEMATVDVASLLRSLHEQFAPMAAQRGLDLRLHARDLRVRSDRALLRRVLQNFIANALRYTQHGGVLLAARRRGARVELQVWDTGPGIPAEHCAVIFEEFQRLDQPSPWGEKGLGLGLSICDRITRMLGHPLALRSALGRGSVFSVQAPCDKASPPLPVEAALPTRDVSGLHALCVDNDPSILEGMRLLLTRWGLQVRTATGLESGLLAVREGRPDLLLVDLHLGESLDGMAVLDILRRECGPNPPPGALITAEGGDELQRRAREQGYPVLQKPVKPAALRALIAALGKRRATGSSRSEGAEP
ncbi:MAG: Sensory/regulatory protein RpfC [Alphaproteobacteria bacterium ADurb.BinA280]|jgi:Na+/proline symporter/signal transduction histidine kinase|nr:hybrid sensor histidine kinase/response regulator [Xanthomonadales bacterium]MCC6506740.1 hybrid sensor histidine kinase/response regulator [Aquimonas sp.]OPZ13855.1 MAG: Sensory/regulatory protein RpfC [Alphaproteobacteria bacterium ADurb.BinA280]